MTPADGILRDLVRRYPGLAPCAGAIEEARELLLGAVKSGGKILLCGNGGSASDCDHIAAELLKGLAKPRPLSEIERQSFGPEGAELAKRLQGAVPAISLPSQGCIHSAFANDADGEYTLAQLTWALGRPGDLLWGISTSGRSRNVIHALAAAKAKGMATLGLIGRDGGAMKALCDVAILAPGADTQQIQEHHLPIYHALCLMLEEALF